MAKREQRKETKQKAEKTGTRKPVILVLVLLIIIIAGIAYSFMYTPIIGGNINTFKNSFATAQRVAIYAMGYNGTALSSTSGCATFIIESIVSSRQNHRNASTIDYYVLNRTNCVYSSAPLGSISSNYIITSQQNCLNASTVEPSIFINYSQSNTTLIQGNRLYVSGNKLFLAQCGIAQSLG